MLLLEYLALGWVMIRFPLKVISFCDDMIALLSLKQSFLSLKEKDMSILVARAVYGLNEDRCNG